MYNRYIPQPDGSYRKNKLPEPAIPEQKQRPVKPQPVPPPPPPPPPPEENRMPSPPRQMQRQEQSAGAFLRQLLPKNMDTGDLMIVLLLLLMAGESTEDKNTALLTLALYLFL